MDRLASSLRRVFRIETAFTMLLAAAMPLYAQHGGHVGGGGGFHGGGGGGFRAGGGFASRPAPAFHASGGGGTARAFRPAGVGRGIPSRPMNAIPYRAAPGFRPGYGARRPAYPGRPGRHPHRPVYNYGGGVTYTGTILPYGLGPWYGYGDLGFPYDDSGYDSTAYDSQQQNPGYDPGNTYVADAAPEAEGPPAAGYNYGAPQAPMPSAPQAPAQPQEAVTLVFNNGAPNQQIHNYILSRDTLTVLDGKRRQIPVASIDLAATEKANQAAGVDFALPGSR